MVGFDPRPYVIKIAREVNGRVRNGQTSEPRLAVGELRLD